MDIERRIAAVPLVAARGVKPKIEGYAAVFNSLSGDLGGWRETLHARAFDDVLASKPDVVALFNHNHDIVLGRTTSGTLQLSVDNRGLRYSIDPPKSRADILEAIERGDVTGSSFAFVVEKGGDEWRSGNDGVVREVRKVAKLIDVSPVVNPAYLDTSVAKRSFAAIAAELLPGISLDEARRRIRILELQ